MSETLRRVQTLVLAGAYRVSDHAYEEMREDAILIGDIVDSIAMAALVEDYRERNRVLALHHDTRGKPIHVVWAISTRQLAVLVTAYRPSPDLWDSEFRERKQ